MAYILGYIVADGCIINKDQKRAPIINITSKDIKHLYRLKKSLNSEHKISKKHNGGSNHAFQLQFRNRFLATDLMNLGIFPRKTHNLSPLKIPDKYFPDFFRGFFDGDGSVYIYKVNNIPQIKSSIVSVSLSFISDLNRKLCKHIGIAEKAIHKFTQKGKMIRFNVDYYIDDSERLYKFLYNNNPVLFLPRKKHIFEKWQTFKRRNFTKRNYPSKIGWHLNKLLPRLQTF